MRWFRFLVVAVVAVLLQTTLVRLLRVGAARPDLMVAALVAFSVGVRRRDGFVVGGVVGLLRDLMSSEPFGLSTMVFAVLGHLVCRARSTAVAEHALTHALLGLVCSAATSAASAGAIVVPALVSGRPLPSASWALRMLVGTALLTAVASAVVGAFVWRRRRWFGLRTGREFGHV